MKYIQKTFKEAAELNWDEPYGGLWEEVLGDDDGGWDDYDYRFGIWEVEDGIGYKFVGSDGGEPEDNSLNRDWAWVVDELNAAYLQGIKDAQNELAHV